MTKQQTYTGRLTLTARGFGFVQAPEQPSVLVPFDHLGHALSGDRVTVEVFPDSQADKPAGRVVEIKERDRSPIVGRVRRSHGELRLYPQANRSPKALVLPESLVQKARLGASLKDGDVVSAELVEWPQADDHPTGKPVRVVARRGDTDLELRLVALSRGLPLEFPDDVERAAEKLELPRMAKIARKRRDLRSVDCFTIDPETAKDFDDAVSIRQRDDGLFELGVHIADVSYYVDPDDTIDKEAWERATSVYLVDTVLPMLPEALSNNLCSLVPNEPRLAMSVIAAVDSTGEVHEVEICESVIESKRRFTYQEAEEIIHGKRDPFSAQIQLLHLVTRTLRTRREARGSVDLDFSTPQIRVDENGVPVSVRPSERLDANRLIEECMLLANRIVAEHLEAADSVPGIYRVHDEPRESDLKTLIQTLQDLGIPYKPHEDVESQDYRNILSIIQNFEFRDLVETVAMKALKKAIYSTENRGHFGLAMNAYTHFTSPIRRYPDLVVHRLVKRTLGPGGTTTGRRAEKKRRSRGRTPSASLERFLEKTCEHSSERERLATEAEREYSRIKALEFLQTKLGREYGGVVSGVASIGLFVEIERYLIEGLVHISKLGRERFELDRATYRLVGSKTGTEYRLGDQVRVKVKSVDIQERTADFDLMEKRSSRGWSRDR
ncbi:MAG: ribonuclease R, partial [Spirochaetota bacterium]